MRRNVAGLLAGTMAASMSLSGCSLLGGSTGSAPPAASTDDPSAAPEGPPIIDKKAAETQLAKYVRINNKSNRQRDLQLLKSYEAGSSFAIDEAGYKAGKKLGKRPWGKFKYVDPTYYAPAAGEKKWFLAEGYSQGVGKKATKAKTPTYLLFADTGSGWRQIYAPRTLPGDRPKLQVTGAGSAAEVPFDQSKGLLDSPANFVKVYAEHLSKPGDSPHKQLLPEDDALTKDAVRHDAKMAKWSTVERSVKPAPKYPSQAFRTADGGALVLTTFRRKMRYDVRPGSWVYNDSLPGTTGKNRKYMVVNSLIQVAAHIPPAGGEKTFSVLGSYSGNISGKAA